MDELPVSDVDAAVGGGAGGEIRILKEHQIPRLQFPEACLLYTSCWTL